MDFSWDIHLAQLIYLSFFLIIFSGLGFHLGLISVVCMARSGGCCGPCVNYIHRPLLLFCFVIISTAAMIYDDDNDDYVFLGIYWRK